MSGVKKERRKLNNWLLDFSYRHTKLFFGIVSVLCVLSFIVPVLSVTAGSTGAQFCGNLCAVAVSAKPSCLSCVSAVLTGLVNALAVISVAIGIYSIAEAKAGSEENAATSSRIGEIHSSLQAMLLQMEKLQAGVNRAADRLDSVCYKLGIGYGEATEESDDFGSDDVDVIDR